MLSTSYHLLADQDHDIIIHEETGLRVHVFNLENEGFVPTVGELHLFGDDHGTWLAFETEEWTTETLAIFSNAVLWYAVVLDYPEMQIATVDPRPPLKLRLV